MVPDDDSSWFNIFNGRQALFCCHGTETDRSNKKQGSEGIVVDDSMGEGSRKVMLWLLVADV